MDAAKLSPHYVCESFILSIEETRYESAICLAKHIPLTFAKSILHHQEYEHFFCIDKQAGYLLGHFAAKQCLLACNHHINAKDILIETNIFSYPLISKPEGLNYGVSYSHSNDLCLAIAFSEKMVLGVGIEKINKHKLPMIKTLLTREEILFIHSIKNADVNLLYTLFWTAKKSLSKALRTGQTVPFVMYELQNLSLEESVFYNDFVNFGQYRCASFMIADYVCSVVFPLNATLSLPIKKMTEQVTKFLHYT